MARLVILASVLLAGCHPQRPAEEGIVEPVGAEQGTTGAQSTSEPDGCWQERPCPLPGFDPPLSHCYAPWQATPCGPANCYEAQRAGAEQACARGETDACDGMPCTVDGDCASPDLRCVEGGCRRIECTASSSCSGRCVAGLCYQQAGRCFYPPGTPLP